MQGQDSVMLGIKAGPGDSLFYNLLILFIL